MEINHISQLVMEKDGERLKAFYRKKLQGKVIVKFWGAEVWYTDSVFARLRLSDEEFVLSEYQTTQDVSDINEIRYHEIKEHMEKHFVGKTIINVDFRINDFRQECYIYAYVDTIHCLKIASGNNPYNVEALRL